MNIDVHLAHFKVLKTIGQGAFGKVVSQSDSKSTTHVLTAKLGL